MGVNRIPAIRVLEVRGLLFSLVNRTPVMVPISGPRFGSSFFKGVYLPQKTEFAPPIETGGQSV